jgi:thiamine kinase-like enzyme
MVGILHKNYPDLAFDDPFSENFDIPFAPKLLEKISRLENIGETDRTGISQLKRIILTWKTRIVLYLDQLIELQSKIRIISHNLLVCHTDLHGGNLVQTPEGILYLLDWENAMIAPREQDMIFFLGDEEYRKLFWPVYLDQVGQVDIDLDVLSFYYYRRGLEDVAGIVFRIMRQDGTEERDRQDLGWLKETLDDLKSIPEMIEGVTEFLSLPLMWW